MWTTRGKITGSQPSVDFAQGPTHPGVNVSRVDAETFCAWLTAQEMSVGRLQTRQSYRPPTDRERSHAAGLPDKPGDTPEGRATGGCVGFIFGQAMAAADRGGDLDVSETGA